MTSAKNIPKEWADSNGYWKNKGEVPDISKFVNPTDSIMRDTDKAIYSSLPFKYHYVCGEQAEYIFYKPVNVNDNIIYRSQMGIIGSIETLFNEDKNGYYINIHLVKTFKVFDGKYIMVESESDMKLTLHNYVDFFAYSEINKIKQYVHISDFLPFFESMLQSVRCEKELINEKFNEYKKNVSDFKEIISKEVANNQLLEMSNNKEIDRFVKRIKYEDDLKNEKYFKALEKGNSKYRKMLDVIEEEQLSNDLRTLHKVLSE